mgnify:CR=1 FL=1
MIEFFQFVTDWLNNDMFDFFDNVFVQIASWYVIWQVEFQIVFLKFTWEVSKEVLATLDITTAVAQAWGQVDSKTMAYFNFFKIPDCLNILINAGVTRLVMTML